MSNYKIETYKIERVCGLTYHWRIALYNMLFIVLPSVMLIFLLGHDIESIYNSYSHNLTWWMLLLITFGFWWIYVLNTLLFIYVFKWFGFEIFNVLMPISVVLLSLTMSSAFSEELWFLRIILCIVLFFSFYPTILVNKRIAKKQLAKKKQQDLIQRQKNKSLLD
ncbi:hypothetical protein [Mycoplasma zalophi]|uniref:Transporter n=1 Tax=Mycoplasma zalophi TaxID=191287 RepID=A0ABS6DPA1_9MOLU|nr:hypothetical protein [Mycoplasma zalophi]MBU4691123.1 hypothetical protein [Mycoplasma zalophi]MBU4692103.1 hypothetical protein [Mycoplasma zalophi]